MRLALKTGLRGVGATNLLFALALAAMFLPAYAAKADEVIADFRTRILDSSSSPFRFGELRGKVVYVDFWASWCAPCRVSFPVLDSLADKYAAQGFAVVGVNQDESARDRDAFRKKVPVRFTLVEDGGHNIAKLFDVKAMPSGYLIDRKGVLRYVHAGFDATTPQKLESEIMQLLKEGRQ